MKKQNGDIIEQKTTDYIIRVDRKKCISAGQCVIALPELFILDNKQISSFKTIVKKVNKKKFIRLILSLSGWSNLHFRQERKANNTMTLNVEESVLPKLIY